MEERPEPSRKRSHAEMARQPQPSVANKHAHERTSSTVVDVENLSSSPKELSTETAASTDTFQPQQGVTRPQDGPDESAVENNGEAEVVSTNDDPKSPIEDFDWDDLEERFRKEMLAKDQEERMIYEDFDRLMALFTIWSQEGQAHETHRAVKRLKTRIRYVQVSEEQLQQRTDHYQNVVKAFESALALLTGPSF